MCYIQKAYLGGIPKRPYILLERTTATRSSSCDLEPRFVKKCNQRTEELSCRSTMTEYSYLLFLFDFGSNLDKKKEHLAYISEDSNHNRLNMRRLVDDYSSHLLPWHLYSFGNKIASAL